MLGTSRPDNSMMPPSRRRRRRLVLARLLVLPVLVLLVLLKETNAQQQQEPSRLLSSFLPATEDRFQWLGRVVRDERSRVTFDWGGVTARFGVSSASAVEVLVDDATPTGTRFLVSLDGGPDGQFQRQPMQLLQTRRGLHSYLLAGGAVLVAAGNVTVSLLHTQEPHFIDSGPSSNITVLGFATDGFFQKGGPPRLLRRLEFIGDSITAGYGAAAVVVPCEASIFTNDYSATYARLLCESFGAECFVTAFSGIGMYKSYPDPNPNNSLTMPERYHDALAGVPGAFSWQPGRDGGGWVPDAVCINLGTNDFQPGREDDPAFVAAFASAYVGFVATLADSYARAATGAGGQSPPVFFLAVGPMRMTYAAAVQEVLRRLAVDRPDIKALYLDLGLDSGYEAGCRRHPGATAHRAMADKARAVIAQAMGWAD